MPRHAQMGGDTHAARGRRLSQAAQAGGRDMSPHYLLEMRMADFEYFFSLSLDFDPFRSGCCRGATTEEEDEDEAAADADTDGTATARRRVQRVLLLPTPRGELVRGRFCSTLKNDC